MKETKAELALVMQHYKESDRSFKLLEMSLKTCNGQFEMIHSDLTEYDFPGRVNLVEKRARDNEVRLDTLMKVGFLAPAGDSKSIAGGKAEELNEKIIINPDDWKQWKFLKPNNLHERPTFHCPFFDKDGCIFVDEASVNDKQENLWHSYGAWEGPALKGKSLHCKAKQCCHWSFGPTLAESTKYGFGNEFKLLHFPWDDHTKLLERNNKFTVRNHLKETHGLTEDEISKNYPTLESDRKSKKSGPIREVVEILYADVSNDKDPSSK